MKHLVSLLFILFWATGLHAQTPTVELEEVLVTPDNPNANVTSPKMSIMKINAHTLRQMPALMGEVDLLKAIQLMPGVQSTSEGSTGFNVRGGHYDQNLILLDEATIYNASHLMGFFSVFNPDVVHNAQLYKGDLPAAYGGRLSSLLDVRTRDGNNQRFGGAGGIGLISSRLMFEGPVVKDRSSFLIAGRRTYFDLFTPLVSEMRDNDARAYFYDLNAKLTWRIDHRNRLSASLYNGKDSYGMNLAAMEFGNTTFSLRWNHIFSSRLYANVTATGVGYSYRMVNQAYDRLSERYASELREYGIKADFSWQIHPDNELQFGYRLAHHAVEPGSVVGIGRNTALRNIHLKESNAVEQSLYVSDEVRAGRRFILRYGLRATAFRNPDNGGISRYALDPRMGLTLILDERQSLRMSYTGTSQFVQMLSNSSSGSPLDVWFHASRNVKPQLGHQFAAGYYRNFKQDTYEFSIEGYYKLLRNAIDFRDHAELLLNEHFEEELRFGKGYVCGLEVTLAKRQGRLTGWLSYTYTRSMKKINTVNNGEWYQASTDKPVNLTTVLNYKLSPRWEVAANWILASGMPVTYPTGRYKIENRYVPIYSGRNEYRYPAYHRLDLSATWHLARSGKRWKHSLNFAVYNAYGRRNPWMVYFKQEAGNPDVLRGEMMYLFTYVPSITWNFSF